MTPFEPGSPTPPTPRDLLQDPRDLASEGWTISPVPFDPFVPPTDGQPSPEAPPPDSEEDETPAEEYAHARPGALGRGVLRSIAASPVIRIPAAVIGGSVFIATLYVLTTRPQLAQPAPESSVQSDAEALPVVPFAPDEPYTFRGLDIHPDRMFGAYFGGAFIESANADSSAGDRDFAYRLAMYRRSYGVDDNFTISVFDERTGERLETSTLSALQSEYEATGRMNWDTVDAARRGETSRLRAKWEAAGIPRDAVTVRWGRANQTHEARTRDLPYLSYEIQLARRLGLSLLSTEIGTVETFNQDWLVSSAGARSRYQMMPDIMEMFGVEEYRVPVVSGGTVQVREELHPLLSMEPSMMLLRGYANAVGHELPGISAYHTGPGNLFILYQTYIRAHAANPPTDGHVSDAYMWGITDGFQAVDEQSSFGPESRAYVMKAYGSLRATENEMVDPAETFRGERVRMRREAATSLGRLLQTLAAAPRLDWGPGNDRGGLYTRFRRLNPHIDLPAAPTADSFEVPPTGDLRLTATADGKPIRFFLPAGSADFLRRAGFDLFAEVTPFDEHTFEVERSDVTAADRAYDALVEDIGHFGFTTRNKARLDALSSQMQSLAAQHPESRYRQTQAFIIRIHQSVWNTRGFRDLAATVETFLSYLPQRRADAAEADRARTEPTGPDSTTDPAIGG